MQHDYFSLSCRCRLKSMHTNEFAGLNMMVGRGGEALLL